MTGSDNSGQRRKETAIAQRGMLKSVTGKHELDMSVWHVGFEVVALEQR